MSIEQRAAAPPTRRQDVVENIHGQEIRDPYRWLEDESSAEVAEWTAAQNAYTREALGAVPGREWVRRRLEQLLSTGTVTAPVVRGERHFYTRREGTQDQPVLLLRRGASGPEQVLLDPNKASEAGTVALDWWYPSWDGRLLAYGYSEHGDEKSTLYLLDVDTGTLLPDAIPHTRYASVAWEPDNAGFYYTRYPAPGSV
ncbi:MAG: S9 family peptidase, partial [Chloroflexota bacterium]|nr:S9 family peptidase [Chloroflexota bacterium]